MAGHGRLVKRAEQSFEITGLVPHTVERITELHASYYLRRHGFAHEFETDIEQGMREFVERFNENHDGAWTLIDNGRVEGGVFIDAKNVDTQGCRLRWFIVNERFHGQGAGRALFEPAIEFCRAKRYPRVHLWTVDALERARTLYRRAGFARVVAKPSSRFGPALVEEKYELVFDHGDTTS